MNRKVTVVLLALLVGLSLGACKKQQSAGEGAGGKVLARVNGTAITEGDLSFWLGGAHGQTVTPEMKARLLERVIELELLSQKGLALGLDRDPTYRARVAKMRQQLKAMEQTQLKRLVIEKEVAAGVDVTADAAQQYFAEHKAEIQTDWHLYSLSYPDDATAQAALAKIRGGESFESVAEQTVKAKPSAKIAPSWDMGFVPWVRVPQEWHEAVFKLQPGEVSGVLRGQKTGIRIVKLVAKQPHPRELQFDAVEETLTAQLREKRLAAAMEAYLAKLRQDAKIEMVGDAK